jgi:hypothetical protein
MPPEQQRAGKASPHARDQELAPIDVVEVNQAHLAGKLLHAEAEAERAAVHRVALEVKLVHRLEQIGDELFARHARAGSTHRSRRRNPVRRRLPRRWLLDERQRRLRSGGRRLVGRRREDRRRGG